MKKIVCLIVGIVLLGTGWGKVYAVPEVSNIGISFPDDPRNHPGDVTLAFDLSDTEEGGRYLLEVEYQVEHTTGGQYRKGPATLEEGSSVLPGLLLVEAGHHTLTWQSSIDEGGARHDDYIIQITPYDYADTAVPGVSASSDTFSLDNQYVKSMRITSATGEAELELHGTKIKLKPGAFSEWFRTEEEEVMLTIREIIKGSPLWTELRAKEKGLPINHDDELPSHIEDVLDDTYREFRSTRNSDYYTSYVPFTSDLIITTIPYDDVATHEIEKEFRIYGLKPDGWVMPDTLERLPGVIPTEGQSIDTYENLVTAAIPRQLYLVPYYRLGVIYAPDFRNVVVYPNPYKPYDGQMRTGDAGTGIIFINLPEARNQIKVYNLAGELVRESPTTWVSWTWDTKNNGGNLVESGVYFYVITNERGEVKTGKLAVIR